MTQQASETQTDTKRSAYKCGTYFRETCEGLTFHQTSSYSPSISEESLRGQTMKRHSKIHWLVIVKWVLESLLPGS